ncbi:MAG: UDP-N-acetylglucosamine--N-acetylmuramyl-(pentapeptide) pyrophosphoryl-undecaprenol N-acetylglucosamine transferase [Candidatus Pacebacteria bacterium]|nr:UDP-N-acetylglucosamine--N-acetylmuramyl-(pentapeptide) pyrophosphoryl-undecaprenol N-acetylglucosamine transferase [Candidatus Paceibacterota bacterium]
MFSKDKKIRILLISGGSGGHVFPVIAVYERLLEYVSSFKEKGYVLEIAYLGNDDYTIKYFENTDILIKKIQSTRLNSKGVKKMFDVFKLARAFIDSFIFILGYMPDVVFAKGCFASLPGLFISRLFKINYFLHESDIVPGKVNTMFVKNSVKTFISFKETEHYLPENKVKLVGNPIRKAIKGARSLDNIESKKILGFEENMPCVLVLGGSQGALSLNDLVLNGLHSILEKNSLIVQTGDNNYAFFKQQVDLIFDGIVREEDMQKRLVFQGSFGDNDETSISVVYSACDLVVARSGAGNLFEIAYNKKPSILIPLPNSSSDHQMKNALNYSQATSAIVLEQDNVKSSTLVSTINSVLSDVDLYRKMAKGTENFSLFDGDSLIAKDIVKFLINRLKN